MKVNVKHFTEVKTEMTIEETVECFGRESVAKWLRSQIQIQHQYEVRSTVPMEKRCDMEFMHQILEDNKLFLEIT